MSDDVIEYDANGHDLYDEVQLQDFMARDKKVNMETEHGHGGK